MTPPLFAKWDNPFAVATPLAASQTFADITCETPGSCIVTP